jgi:hypothetical protein
MQILGTLVCHEIESWKNLDDTFLRDYSLIAVTFYVTNINGQNSNSYASNKFQLQLTMAFKL